MKFFFNSIIILLACSSHICFGQLQNSTLKGRAIDPVTNEALPFASVSISQASGEATNIVGVVQTGPDGTFLFEKIKAGSYTLKVTYVGYQNFEQPIELQPNQVLDVKNISVQPESKLLKEVEVVAEKSPVELAPGKRIFNVDKSLTSIGGTAESLLRNVPSVTIDESGAASLRNMSATIYVNNKPTQLTLAQIPANQIASIEVISNPSARYDASTSGGIINLVLKQNREQGYNGNVSIGVGNNNRYDGTLNLDWQQGKWNVTSLYSFNSTKNPLNGYAHRINKNDDGSAASYFDQSTAISLDNIFQSGRVAADYHANKSNVISLAGTIVAGSFNTISNQAYSIRDASGNVVSIGDRNTIPHNGYVNSGAEFDYKHLFPQKGRELTFISSLTHSRVSNAGDWLTTAYNVEATGTTTTQPGYPVQNAIDGRIIGNQVLAQLDYVHPVSESAKLELGLRSFSYLRDQQYLFSEVNGENKSLLQNYSQNAQINESVNAVYGLYSQKLKNQYSFQAGLRLEQSFLHGLSHFDETKFGYNYPSKTGQNLFQSFFPSFSLDKKIDDNSEWNFSLSRKVGRPNFRHMFLGIQANDKQNIMIGNPAIRPEFINTAEVNYNKTWEGHSENSLQWLSTGYYIYEDHTIKPVTQPLQSDSSILVTTFQNIKADVQYGIDNTLNYSAGPLSIVANFNAYEAIIQSIDVTNKMLRYNAKLSLGYKFGSGFSAQLSGQRRSKGPQLQGYQKAVTAADFALRKGFWKNRASLTFIINDIFNSRRFVTIYDQPLAYQTSMNRREIRYYKLTLQLPLSKVASKTKAKRIADPDIDFGN
jgi:outer membrane receptor protein involved in Fe transport